MRPIDSNDIRTVQKAAAGIPQTTAEAIFNINNGKVLVTGVYGEVTVELGAGANNAKLTSNPTVGASVDICATVDVDTDVVGTMYSTTGTFANAMIATTSGALEAQAGAFVIAAGTLDLDCDASKAGSVKWTIQYIPVDAGATISAA